MRGDLERVTWVCRNDGDDYRVTHGDICATAGAYVQLPDNDKVYVCPNVLDNKNNIPDGWRETQRRTTAWNRNNAKEQALVRSTARVMIHELAHVARPSSSKYLPILACLLLTKSNSQRSALP